MPGESVGEAFVTIRADTTGFESEAKRTVGGVLTGLATGFAAIKVGQFFKSAFNEAEEAQKVFAQTEAVIKSTGGAAGVTAKQVGDYAGKLSDLAAIDDEVIQSGENMLLTFKNIGSEIFNRTTKATLDLAAGMAASSGGTIDMKASAIQLGKALNDPVAGISALTRVGVQFTEQQKEQIATLVASGDVLGAQKIILKEVEAQFKGSAAAQATDSAKLQVAYGNLKESLGTALLPAINAVANALTPLAKMLAENQAVAVAFAVVIGGAVALALAAYAINMGRTVIETFKGISALLRLGGAAQSAASGLGAGVGLAGGLVGLAYMISQVTGKTYDLAKGIDDMIRASGRAQVTLFAQAAAATALEQQMSGAAAKLQVFSALAKDSPGTAQRLIDTLKAAGENTDAFEKALRREIAAQNQATTDRERGTVALDKQTGAVKSLEDQIKDLNTYINAQIDAELSLEGAHLRVDQAIKGATETLAANTAESLEGRAAILDVKTAVDAYGQSVYDNAILAGKSVEESVAIQKWNLGILAGTLEPGSPLRLAVEQYVNTLNAIPTDIRTLASFDAIFSEAALKGFSAIRAVGFATGGVVPGPKGAPMLAVVHGQEEVLTPEQREARGNGGGSGLMIQGDLNVYDREVISTLDYWAQTRMAGV